MIHFRLGFSTKSIIQYHPAIEVPPWLWKPPEYIAIHLRMTQEVIGSVPDLRQAREMHRAGGLWGSTWQQAGEIRRNWEIGTSSRSFFRI